MRVAWGHPHRGVTAGCPCGKGVFYSRVSVTAGRWVLTVSLPLPALHGSLLRGERRGTCRLSGPLCEVLSAGSPQPGLRAPSFSWPRGADLVSHGHRGWQRSLAVPHVPALLGAGNAPFLLRPSTADLDLSLILTIIGPSALGMAVSSRCSFSCLSAPGDIHQTNFGETMTSLKACPKHWIEK